MLNVDELTMLTELFVKKMQKQIPELYEAIKAKDYKKIALISHSIKGSVVILDLKRSKKRVQKWSLWQKIKTININMKLLMRK